MDYPGRTVFIPPAKAESPGTSPEVTPITEQESSFSLKALVSWAKDIHDSFRRGKAENLETQVDKIEDDLDRYSDSAEQSLKRREPATPWQPLGDWEKAHRRKTPDRIFKPDGSRPVKPVGNDIEGEARTRTQEFYGRRGGLRVDALNKIDHEIAKLTELYGDILYDEEAVSRYLTDPSVILSPSAKKGIRKASKEVRELQERKERIQARAEKAVDNEDLPGRILSRRANRKDEKARKIRRKLI